MSWNITAHGSDSSRARRHFFQHQTNVIEHAAFRVKIRRLLAGNRRRQLHVSAGTGIAPAGLPRLHGDLELYDFLIQQAEELKKKPAIRPPLLTGKYLIGLGMKPGPAMGALLNEIREKQLADELKNVRQAKAWAKKQIGHLEI